MRTLTLAETKSHLSAVVDHPSTEAALAWLEQAGKETIRISPWTRTEFASAAGIMARRGDISAPLHGQRNDGSVKLGSSPAR